MTFNFSTRLQSRHALLAFAGLLAGSSALAQDLSVPADPVAAIEGDWNGIWEDWSVTVTNGRVVLTKGDPKTYSWLPVGTVLGVLNNNGKSEPRAYRFSGSTCLDHNRDQSPSEYKIIPCGDFGAVLSVYADSYELKVSAITLRRLKNASRSKASDRRGSGDSRKPTVEIPESKDFFEGSTPRRSKMTNAEADAKYEAHMAEYKKQLSEQQKQVEAYNRAQDEIVRKKDEQKLAAERAAADYQKQLEAHAQTVRNQQAEYQKELAKPAGVPNAVYRGFLGADCDAARRSATLGAGTSSTTRFKEVTFAPSGNTCLVQGWWWNVPGGGTATRQ
jgi:hypothetical protein